MRSGLSGESEQKLGLGDNRERQDKREDEENEKPLEITIVTRSQ